MFTYFIPHTMLSSFLQVQPDTQLRVLAEFFGAQCEYVTRYSEQHPFRCVKVHGDVSERVTVGMDGYGLYNAFAQRCELFPEGLPIWVTDTDVPVPMDYHKSHPTS